MAPKGEILQVLRHPCGNGFTTWAKVSSRRFAGVTVRTLAAVTLLITGGGPRQPESQSGRMNNSIGKSRARQSRISRINRAHPGQKRVHRRDKNAYRERHQPEHLFATGETTQYSRTFISVDWDAKSTPLGTVFGNSKEEAPSKTLRIAGAI